jgi:hypothetical protein
VLVVRPVRRGDELSDAWGRAGVGGRRSVAGVSGGEEAKEFVYNWRTVDLFCSWKSTSKVALEHRRAAPLLHPDCFHKELPHEYPDCYQNGRLSPTLWLDSFYHCVRA